MELSGILQLEARFIKNACRPHARQMMTEKINHSDPLIWVLSPWLMLNARIDNSANTIPSVPRKLILSFSNTSDIITVMAGEIDIIGKTKYAGAPIPKVLNNNSC